jgi:hypothetical protein
MKIIAYFIFTVTLSVVSLSSCNNLSDKKSQEKTSKDTLLIKNQEEYNTDEFKKTSNTQETQKKEAYDIESRIQVIRDWYREVEDTYTDTTCKTKKRISFDSFDDETEQFSFTQRVKTCKIEPYFEVVKTSFSGYGYAYGVSIYKKKNKIFFVFINGSSEGWSYEKRFYVDENENIIRHLEKEAFDGEAFNEPNKEVNIDPKKQSIRNKIKEHLKQIDWVLEGE